MKSLHIGTVFLLKQTELALRSCAEVALAEVDLTPSQYFILFHVKHELATSAAELARAMGILPQSITELIAPLEQGGVIVRRPDASNNRILRITLSAAGERLYSKGTKVAIRLERELVEDFDQSSLNRLNDALFRLKAKAESHVLHPRSSAAGKTSSKSPRSKAASKRRSASG